MKKLIYIVIITFVLLGCGYSPANMEYGAIISRVEQNDNNKGCFYYTKTTAWAGNAHINLGYFFDKCGKFTVGDTVVVQKIKIK